MRETRVKGVPSLSEVFQKRGLLGLHWEGLGDLVRLVGSHPTEFCVS